MDPNDPWNHYDLALVYEQMGKPAESIHEYLKFESLSGAEPQTIARLREAFGKSGARGFWRRRLEDYREAAKSGYVNAGMVAQACARVGERDCAFEWLEKGFQDRSDLLVTLNADPVFDGIRTDPAAFCTNSVAFNCLITGHVPYQDSACSVAFIRN